MNFKKLCLLALMALGTMAYATIDLRTTIRDVYYRGTCEQAGIIVFSVNGNDFPDASTNEPVYIRLRLDQDAELCKTLVWSHNNNSVVRTRLPIYLPLTFDSIQSGVWVNADDETISIVRWKRGEDEIWIKVQTSSNTWLTTGGAPFAPDNNNRVKWTVGVTAKSSWDENNGRFTGNPAQPLSSLPSAQRKNDGGTFDNDTNAAVSTLICVDLSGSSLENNSSGDASILEFDRVSFDSATQNVEGGFSSSSIVLGRQINVAFSGDDEIARGRDARCTGSILTKNPNAPTEELCLFPGTSQGATDDGLRCIENSIALRISCSQGDQQWGFHRESFVEVATESGSQYGFLLDLDADGDPIEIDDIFGATRYALDAEALNVRAYNAGDIGVAAPILTSGVAMGETGSTFELPNGDFLSRRAWAFMSNGTGTNGTIDMTINAKVWMWYDNDADDVLLDVDVWASNIDSVIDIAPFDGYNGTDGFDQEFNCDPSYLLAFELDWEFGEFIDCVFVNCTRIFFQYVPALRGADSGNPDWWAGLSFVNHGNVDLNLLQGYAYESDGSPWLLNFPGLAVRNQQTWLMIYDADAGSVVLEDSRKVSADQLYADVVPTAQGEDLVFGDMRHSLYLVGCNVTDSAVTDSSAAPDLDGYLLLGTSNGDVAGSYAARNIELTFTNQDGDLPVLGFKRANGVNQTKGSVPSSIIVKSGL